MLKRLIVVVMMLVFVVAPALAEGDPDVVVTWDREHVWEWVCGGGTCKYVSTFYTNEIRVAAEAYVTNRAVSVVQLDDEGEPVDTPVVLGTLVASAGCPYENTTWLPSAHPTWGDACDADGLCYQQWNCQVGGNHTAYGWCSTRTGYDGWMKCQCIVPNPCPYDDRPPVTGGPGWTPKKEASWVGFDACENPVDFTVGGTCGDELPSCYPLCGGPSGY